MPRGRTGLQTGRSRDTVRTVRLPGLVCTDVLCPPRPPGAPRLPRGPRLPRLPWALRAFAMAEAAAPMLVIGGGRALPHAVIDAF